MVFAYVSAWCSQMNRSNIAGIVSVYSFEGADRAFAAARSGAFKAFLSSSTSVLASLFTIPAMTAR